MRWIGVGLIVAWFRFCCFGYLGGLRGNTGCVGLLLWWFVVVCVCGNLLLLAWIGDLGFILGVVGLMIWF